MADILMFLVSGAGGDRCIEARRGAEQRTCQAAAADLLCQEVWAASLWQRLQAHWVSASKLN